MSAIRKIQRMFGRKPKSFKKQIRAGEVYTYGIGCTFHGPITKVGKHPETEGLPCCPHCNGMLMQVENESAWWAGIQKAEEQGNTNFFVFMKWVGHQEKCWKNVKEAAEAFTNAHGIDVRILALENPPEPFVPPTLKVE